MNWRFWTGGCLLIGGMACQPGQVDQQQALTVPGVSLELANFRKANYSDVRYLLRFSIPELKQQPVEGVAQIAFRISEPHPLILDFRGD